MARKGVTARKSAREGVPAAAIVRRVVWVALAGLWLFVVVALASFDASDWPSHTVAVHNEPAHNLCGPMGAWVAYNSYHVVGIGSWIVLLGGLGLAAPSRAMDDRTDRQAR